MKSPIKISIKTEAVSLGLVICAFALGSYFFTHFPDQVAEHWNIEGQVDRYTSKTVGAFGMPLMMLGMYVLFLVLPYLDPKKARYADFAKVYNVIKFSILGLILLIYAIMGLFNLGYNIEIGTVVPLLVGLMMIVLGNFMGKIKNNWFVGIKTPWTLSSENVWNKTHRLGGYMFVLFGISLIATPLLPVAWKMISFGTGIIAAVIVPIAYSYLAYKQELNKNTKDKA
jgi:uncharacterized membrane protein